MKRYFFMANTLASLEAAERALRARGITSPQIHVLSQDDAGAMAHHLHPVHSLLRQDTIHGGTIGALIGLLIAAVALTVAWLSGLPEQAGWVPFACLGLVLLGFFTWEGGLFGIQKPHAQFRRFAAAIDQGKHLLIVDVEPAQEAQLEAVLAGWPHVEPAGTGAAAPRWLLRWQQRWHDFLQWAP